MDLNISFALFAFMLSLLAQFFVLKLSGRYALFIDKSDTPKPQRFHNQNISRGGGIGIVLGFSTTLLLFSELFDYFERILFVFVMGAFCVFASGLLEDMTGKVPPKIRLLGQAIGSLISVLALNALIVDIGLGFALPFIFALPFSIFCIVGLSNAMNIIDGFNGLSSGVALLALVAIFFISQDMLINRLSLFLFGAIAGFFVYNFPQGRIFLGDGGAYFIGFIIAFLLIILTQTQSDISAWFAIALLIHPLTEVLFSIFRKRFINHISPFSPDNRHLHSLIYQKLTPNSALTSCLLLILNLPFMMCAFYFAHNTSLLVCTCLLFVVLYLGLYSWLVKK